MIFKIIKYNIIEHFLFLVLAFLAAYYMEERLIADSGYYLFRVIDNESFWIEHNRFILILPEIMPLIAVKIGLSLESILYFYSVGIIFIFYIVFLVARYHYKSESAGILILLLQTIGITSGFFVPMFELYFGTVLLILFSAALYSNKSNKIELFILSFFILTAHQYALFLYVFVLVFHAIKFRKKHIKLYATFAMLIIVVTIFKSYTATAYEQAKTKAFFDNFMNQAYDIEYIKSLVEFLIAHYLTVLLMLTAATSAFIWSKSYLKAASTILGFIGVLAIANISYYGFTFSRYQEQVYFSLSFLAAYPFVLFVFEKQNNLLKVIFVFLTPFIIGLGIYQIHLQGVLFTERLVEMKIIISKAEKQMGDKFIVKSKTLSHYANWSYPIETMLLSARKSPKNTVTICVDEDITFEENEVKLTPDKYLFRRWEIYDVTSLNEKYFKLNNSNYIFIK